MEIFWIDLFCGAGGTTSGIHLADCNAKVVACVNHDADAIRSHKENHPDCLHLTEDIRDFKVVQKLAVLVKNLRKKYPNCVLNLWASLECTNHSNAKGGMPRDADSRTLAYDLIPYLIELKPDGLFIENVREFMAWGPLDENGKPISRKNGADYIKWCNLVRSMGYKFDYKLLNAADFGAYTSRLRYFGQFAKHDFPIEWPEPTHAKEVSEDSGMFANNLKPWKPVREVLDLEDEGVSIFERKRPLSEKTLARIYAGLDKFVANGLDAFTKVYNSGNDYHRVKSLNEPIGSLTTQNSHGKVKAIFLNTYYKNGGKHSIEQPSPTVTTKDRITKVDAQFFMNNYSGGGFISDINNPSPTVTTNPKSNLVTAKHWLVDTQFANKGRSIDRSAPTIIARQDKKPLYLVKVDQVEQVAIAVFEDDSEMTVKIKEFMARHRLADIKMRMLKIPELLRIQGFPEGYKLKGIKTNQKKFIGNAVEVNIAKAIVQANSRALENQLSKAI